LTWPEPDDFVSSAGLGVEARVGGRSVKVGRPAWFSEAGDLDERVGRMVGDLAGLGRTVVLVSVDNRMVGLIGLIDRLKPEAAQVVAGLEELGITPVMVTGDNRPAAKAIAAEVGIILVAAELMPEQKESDVENFQRKGGAVAMVGDGINDAPALARADVGIALGSGAGVGVALEASDITLVGEDLGGVTRAIRLSRAAMRTIRQNLFWAFFYNVALVPVAAGVLHDLSWVSALIRHMHPALAAAAMAAAGLAVVLKSLRLDRCRIQQTIHK